MIDDPSLVGRVYEHYVEFEAIIARAVADRYDLDADRDAYPRLLSTCAMTAVRVALVLWYERGEKRAPGRRGRRAVHDPRQRARDRRGAPPPLVTAESRRK